MKRLLWISDWSGLDGGFITGMGRVSREFCGRLCRDFEVLQGGWHYEGQPHPYPYQIVRVEKGTDQRAFDSLRNIVAQFQPEILVLFGDWFYFPFTTVLKLQFPNLKIVGYINVDSLPISYNFVQSLKSFDKIICSTKWGMDAIANLDPTLNPTYVYHGVDFNTFKKLDNCEFAGFPLNHDMFLVAYNQQNTMRHNPTTAMEGFAKFAEGKKDVMMLMNTKPDDPNSNVNLYEFIKRLPNQNKFMLASNQSILKGIPDAEVNKLYNVATVTLSTSVGEGVGFSILESMATQTPVIATDYASMSELLADGRGFLIKTNNKVVGMHGANMMLPSIRDTEKKLELVYKLWKTKSEKLDHVKQRAFDWIKQFSWDSVYSDMYKEMLDVCNTSVKENIYPNVEINAGSRENILNILNNTAKGRMKIGVVVLGGIGDNLMITPLCRGIKKRYPDSYVMAFVIGGGEVFRNNTDVDIVVELGGNSERKSTVKTFYDLFDLFYDVRGITKVFNEEPSEYFRMNEWFYDNANWSYHDFDMIGDDHFIDMILKSTRYDNLVTMDDINIPITEYKEIPRSPYFIIHNSANEKNSFKELPYKVVTGVVGDLRDKGYWCVQLGRKEDKYIEGSVDFRGCTNLHQSAYVVSKSIGYVGVDGGLVHLAKCVDKKGVVCWSIFNPKNYAYKENINLTTEKCKPCAWRVGWHQDCIFKNKNCINLPSKEEIVSAALTLTEGQLI